ncbi:MAG: hypothetical protein U9R42_00715 [Bacteroidota bacterium]|nr:hypothetical protein [Bacteroidota bacterium]
MDVFIELIKVLLPSVIVFVTAFYILKSFLQNEKDKKLIDVKSDSAKDLIMLKLQAYERVMLLLERIAPENLIVRINKAGMNVEQLHAQLISNLRAEFDHNVAQQLYVSNEAWDKVLKAKSEIAKIINLSKEKVDNQNNSLDLVKIILLNNQKISVFLYDAKTHLKKEAQQLF